MLRAWWGLQGQRGQLPDGSFLEEIGPWSTNRSFPGRAEAEGRPAKGSAWAKVRCERGHRAFRDCRQGPSPEVRKWRGWCVSRGQLTQGVYGAEEIGLCPAGTGEPWKGLEQGEDTTRFACGGVRSGRRVRPRVEIFQGKVTRSELGRGEGREQEWAFVGQKQQNLVSAGAEKEGENQSVAWHPSLVKPQWRNDFGPGKPVLPCLKDRLQAPLEALEGAPG